MKPNPAYDKTCDILRESGYNRLSEFKRAKLAGYTIPESHFEIWAGRKGTIIMQVWNDGNGCSTYANWPLGHTFEALKEAL